LLLLENWPAIIRSPGRAMLSYKRESDGSVCVCVCMCDVCTGRCLWMGVTGLTGSQPYHNVDIIAHGCGLEHGYLCRTNRKGQFYFS
jgi:hypothetical protein